MSESLVRSLRMEKKGNELKFELCSQFTEWKVEKIEEVFREYFFCLKEQERLTKEFIESKHEENPLIKITHQLKENFLVDQLSNFILDLKHSQLLIIKSARR